MTEREKEYLKITKIDLDIWFIKSKKVGVPDLLRRTPIRN